MPGQWSSTCGAHIVAYVLTYGPVPEGKQLDHFVCDNAGCCNPDHVRPTTPRENTLRSNGFASANLAKTHCPRGHELSPENLAQATLRQGRRRCLTCTNELANERRRVQRRATGVPARVHRGEVCKRGHVRDLGKPGCNECNRLAQMRYRAQKRAGVVVGPS